MATCLSYLLLIFFFCFIFRSFTISDAIVPPSDTFRYVNEGGFGELDTEYNPSYRPLPPFTSPFQLCFYNTTPNAYTLALRMGTRRDRSLTRWVWEVNRGRPVRENATFSFGPDGNLVLADSDGKIVWQTNTANKDVVGFAILSDGNIVLRDSKGNFVWQSFDSPTDTLLVGQSLRPIGSTPYKLVSRDSVTNNVNGDFSFVIERKRIALYYKNNMLYWSPFYSVFNQKNVFINNVTIEIAETEYEGNNFFTLGFSITDPQVPYDFPPFVLGTVLYPNSSALGYLRLGIDGNLRFYSYRPDVRRDAWVLMYTLFDKRVSSNGMIHEDECQIPNRCGKFGLCEDSQCVGCPTSNGVFAWSKDCDSKLPGCKASGFRYYELKGVDHFTIKYTSGNGPAKQSDCESKCTKDCKCLGYFYHTDTSRCWVVDELKTLTRVGNLTHLAYIKTPIG